MDEDPMNNQDKRLYTRHDKNYGCVRRFGNHGQGMFNSSKGKYCDRKFRQEEGEEYPSHDNFRQQRRVESSSKNTYKEQSASEEDQVEVEDIILLKNKDVKA
ncbi:hypothetical protein HanRHA438_Chr02g0095271 [Helianthus annuus]|nr:hypothetical protein HanIR_Chr02g0096891 [Helianthus annuus]KAJ0941508.1 hypothetical protein HanRHA438_Chr02g0095271 [Helianthus annuus]